MSEVPTSPEVVGQVSQATVEDIHICGSCKLQFNTVRSFLIHKKSGCSIVHNPVPSSLVEAAPLLQTCGDDENQPQQDFVGLQLSQPNELQPGTNPPCTESTNDVGSSHATVPSVQILCNVDLPIPSASKGESQAPKAAAKPTSSPRKYPEKRFRCEVEGCQYNSQYLKDLLRHIRTHTGEKPFACNTCSKTFNRADKLKLHERWHKGDKPYKCKQCDYATGDCSSLKKHLRVHSDERPFKCQICQYASRNSSQLVVHLRTHTGDSPFQCPYCSTKFKINSDLKRHLRMHTGEKPYACQMCNYRCAIKGGWLAWKHPLNHPMLGIQQMVAQLPFGIPQLDPTIRGHLLGGEGL